MQILKVKVFSFLLVLCLFQILFAATTGKISGIINDSNTGEPLPGVNVVVEGTSAVAN